MSLDRSLKSGSGLIRHRNVLKRPERLLRLADEEKWDPTKAVLGLPKVANRKQTLGKSKDDAAAPGTTPAAGAAATPAAKGGAPAAKAGAPAAKGAAPAAKGAAPAAKAAAPAAKKK